MTLPANKLTARQVKSIRAIVAKKGIGHVVTLLATIANEEANHREAQKDIFLSGYRENVAQLRHCAENLVYAFSDK